jgi:hypothetical protein
LVTAFRTRFFAAPIDGVKLRALDDFAQRHHCLITRAAAEQVGISRSAWYGRSTPDWWSSCIRESPG